MRTLLLTCNDQSRGMAIFKKSSLDRYIISPTLCWKPRTHRNTFSSPSYPQPTLPNQKQSSPFPRPGMLHLLPPPFHGPISPQILIPKHQQSPRRFPPSSAPQQVPRHHKAPSTCFSGTSSRETASQSARPIASAKALRGRGDIRIFVRFENRL